MPKGQELTADLTKLYKEESKNWGLSPNAVTYCQRDRRKKDKMYCQVECMG